MDELLNMFELLDTDKTGRIDAQDHTRILLIIQKMRDYKFDKVTLKTEKRVNENDKQSWQKF